MTGRAVDQYDEYITVAGCNVQLNLYVPGIIRKMTLSDFRKMLTVISHEVDPADFAHCLHLWDNAVAFASVNGDVSLSRVHKLNSIINKKVEKLPAWVVEDRND